MMTYKFIETLKGRQYRSIKNPNIIVESFDDGNKWYIRYLRDSDYTDRDFVPRDTEFCTDSVEGALNLVCFTDMIKPENTKNFFKNNSETGELIHNVDGSYQWKLYGKIEPIKYENEADARDDLATRVWGENVGIEIVKSDNGGTWV